MLILLVGYLAVTQPEFATTYNLMSILEANSVLLLVATGLTLVLLCGGFDLSVGAMLALSGILLAELVRSGANYFLAAVLIVVLAAIVGGLLNGLLIGRLGLSFFVVTLGTMSLFRGTGQVVTEGQSVNLYDIQAARTVGSGDVAGVPWLTVVALTVFVVAVLVTRYTGYGRMLYAVGGNAEAARLAGINVWAVRASTYAVCAGTAALAGVLEASRLGTAAPGAATGMELTAASAVLLGGTSFAGGSGSLIGTLLGTLFLGVISNGLTISQVSSFWQGVVTGLVLLAAVLVDRLRTTRVRPRLWRTGRRPRPAGASVSA
ncbi:ABC transporter permease [Micromonospora sp. CPCC 206060]|uniref:ABC transporter permease n=1 Tax=Micromonospora sp. CPCC 206060 TaxID=3122406 RepID=UPI002FF08C5D